MRATCTAHCSGFEFELRVCAPACLHRALIAGAVAGAGRGEELGSARRRTSPAQVVAVTAAGWLVGSTDRTG
jgi:hypothetical protein